MVQQKEYDKTLMVCSKPMNLRSLSSLQESIASIVKHGRQKFLKPIGNWSDNWEDYVHEEGGRDKEVGE